jgi:MtN3 and saliva related transmembrane protein
MELTIFDKNVDQTMNVFLVIANLLNLIYNVPQMIQTYQTKSTDDINHWFIILRIIGNSIWVVYGIYINSLLLLLNNIITVLATLFIGYYKYQNRLSRNQPESV